jgi:hypothetical protein
MLSKAELQDAAKCNKGEISCVECSLKGEPGFCKYSKNDTGEEAGDK